MASVNGRSLDGKMRMCFALMQVSMMIDTCIQWEQWLWMKISRSWLSAANIFLRQVQYWVQNWLLSSRDWLGIVRGVISNLFILTDSIDAVYALSSSQVYFGPEDVTLDMIKQELEATLVRGVFRIPSAQN